MDKDKRTFDPVTEGTPGQFQRIWIDSLGDEDGPGFSDMLAARDAAMRAEGVAEGRLKGLEEARDHFKPVAVHSFTGHEVITSIQMLIHRAAAETAKEGGDVDAS